MKPLLRRYLLTVTCLIIVKNLLPDSIRMSADPVITLLQAALIMFLLELIVRPIVNLILLPINFLTFGTFKWVTQLVVLYTTDYLTPALQFSAFTIPSLNLIALQTPSLPISGLWVYLALAIIMQAINNLITWIFS